MTGTTDDGRVATAKELQQSRQRLDSSALLASYIATDLLSRIQTFILGAVTTLSILVAIYYSVQLDRLKADVISREQSIKADLSQLEESTKRYEAALTFSVGELRGQLEELKVRE